jgi:FkbM family methyltransferase
MPAVKNISKKVLGAVGLLRPVQSIWYWHLKRSVRRELDRLYRQFISPGDLCFDIGANIGEVSQVLLDLGARVVAVEPQSESIAALQKRFAGNPNFTLVPKAAGSAIGSGELLVCAQSYCTTMSSEYVAAVTESGRLPKDVFHWDEVRQVPITTIDELIETYGLPAFTKIDVEGLEAEVIRGCSRRLKLVSLEFTPERLQPALDCVAMLSKMGEVEFNYTLERGVTLRLSEWVSSSEVARQLKNMHFRIVTAPGGDLYARFK